MNTTRRTARRIILTVVLLQMGMVTAFAANLKRLQYKEQSRRHVTLCARGDYPAALTYARNYLSEHPDDLEAYYIRAMAQANLGRLDEAVRTVRLSLAKGLTFDRYLAGPRDLFAPLYKYPPFVQLAQQQNVRLVHGPMLGAVTDHSARFWVRTVDESTVTITVNASPIHGKNNPTRPVASASARSSAKNDYTAVVEVTGLEPDSRYCYFVSVDDQPVNLAPAPTFVTFPASGQPTQFEVAFGGGAGFTPWHERMWTTLLGRRPLAMLLMGDNVYIDTPEVPQTQRYCYYRRQSRPEYRRFVARTPIFAIWDDHDFGTNDCTSSQSLDQPVWKRDVLKVFTENFANPAYGLDARRPGCFFRFAIADVDFFMLDCRFYRQSPKTVEHPSMIGPAQKAWLFDQLKHSHATFKVIVSSVPWAFGTKPGSKDTWDGFPEEREEIFSFFQKNKIEGVVLLSADRHRSDAWRIARPNAYDLYEMSSSKLTNVHTHPIIRGSLFGYNKKCSAGFLSFNTTLSDPTVTYRVVNIDSEIMNTLTLTKSQLSFQR